MSSGATPLASHAAVGLKVLMSGDLQYSHRLMARATATMASTNIDPAFNSIIYSMPTATVLTLAEIGALTPRSSRPKNTSSRLEWLAYARTLLSGPKTWSPLAEGDLDLRVQRH